MPEPLLVLYAVSAVASTLASSVLWRRRNDTPAAAALAVGLLGTAWWAASVAMGTVLGLQDEPEVLYTVYPGVCAVVLGFWAHAGHVRHTFGHGVGDQLLVAMACALAEDVRPGEVLARFGGEEFVLLAADRALYAAKQSGRDRVVPAEAVGAAA